MTLTILILTHNRPKLFDRCLSSIIKAYDIYLADKLIDDKISLMIYINNDSLCLDNYNEIYNNIIDIKYSYYKDDNLGNIYKYLFNLSSGHIIYIEDDDYLSKNFFYNIDLSYDTNFLKFKLTSLLETIQVNKDFKLPSYNSHFQLSQLLFKKELITNFPDNNDLDNDWNLYIMLKQITNIHLVNKICFVQTQDGQDNISDIRYNKDLRWPIKKKNLLQT